MIFADCRVAAHFADELAAELGVIRPELRKNACVVMTDQGQDGLTYCVAIDEMRKPRHSNQALGWRDQTPARADFSPLPRAARAAGFERAEPALAVTVHFNSRTATANTWATALELSALSP